MDFDPWNCFLKIQKFIGTLTPKVRAHLGVWGFIPSHSPTLPGAWDVTPRLPSWPATLQAFALVASPRLRLWHCYPNLLATLAIHNYQHSLLNNITLLGALDLAKIGFIDLFISIWPCQDLSQVDMGQLLSDWHVGSKTIIMHDSSWWPTTFHCVQ
jgi:hypothetical protein